MPLYYFFREYFSLSIYIYAIFLIALFCMCSWRLLSKAKYLEDLRSNGALILEILILINIFLLLIFFGIKELPLLLMIATLFISKTIAFNQSAQGFSYSANLISVASIICSIGILLGFLEVLFLNTHYFSQVMDFDYPYSNGMEQTTLINGFFSSANGSAYCLGAGLAFLGFQNLFTFNIKRLMYILLTTSLILTMTKFAFLILATSSVFLILKRLSFKYLILFLFGLVICYVFLSHIVIAASGSYVYPSPHFREVLFSLGGLDFILGNYGAFKIYSIEAIVSSPFLPYGLNQFENTYDGRPHFMLGGLFITGGLGLAMLVSMYIYVILKDNLKLKDNFKNPLVYFHKKKFFLVILFCFLVETINWNFSNNFYFWFILMGVSSIGKFEEKELDARSMTS